MYELQSFLKIQHSRNTLTWNASTWSSRWLQMIWTIVLDLRGIFKPGTESWPITLKPSWPYGGAENIKIISCFWDLTQTGWCHISLFRDFFFTNSMTLLRFLVKKGGNSDLQLEENLLYDEIWWLHLIFSEHHLQLNLSFRWWPQNMVLVLVIWIQYNMSTTDMVSVLNLNSQKLCQHQTFLY